jgi:ABC transport system ATP-binding/permease protein
MPPTNQSASSSFVFVRALTIRNRTVGRRAILDKVSFSVRQGEFVALIGPSGCGKSTLLKAIAGVIPSHAGQVLLAGVPVDSLKEAYPLAIGYIPQFAAFHDALTVDEILTFASRLRLSSRVTKPKREAWKAYVIDLAGISHLRDQAYSTLSGGQRRRLALAEELMGDPPILLLDELTSGLDPHSDAEMMQWLADLARNTGKTIVLVTHSLTHLAHCDRVLFLAGGRLVYDGVFQELPQHFGKSAIEEAYRDSESLPTWPQPIDEDGGKVPVIALKTERPPGPLEQFAPLLKRQALLLMRDRSQIYLQLVLVITFPLLVAIFATKGLPQVRNLSLQIETNILHTMADQLMYLKESFSAASLISGLVMFQVILITLMGANNGAREIAKERDLLSKEQRVGLSAGAYLCTKVIQVGLLSVVQGVWMALFVRMVCGFPGDVVTQCAVLTATAFSMSTCCLAISAAVRSPERASLLAIYLVGLQLPLSGAVLALPIAISWVSRPLIAAYWGWSGYLKSFEHLRHYDVVKQATNTYIAEVDFVYLMLGLHCLVSIMFARWFLGQVGKLAK